MWYVHRYMSKYAWLCIQKQRLEKDAGCPAPFFSTLFFAADLFLILELGWWPANPKEPSVSALDSTWVTGTRVAMPGFLRAGV